MKRTHLFMKYRGVYCCAVFCALTMAVGAAQYGRRTRENVTSEKDARLEQMRQEANMQTSKIDQSLRDLLEPVKKNQRAQDDQVQNAQTVLDETKRYAAVMDEKQKAQFMLLQGWTGFYQGNPLQGASWSARACKTDEASQDAWNSQALFSMLLGKRPLIPRMETPERPSRRTSRPRRNGDFGDSAGFSSSVKPYSQRGVLEFDLMGLRSEMFREQFGRLRYQAVDGSEFMYTPGNDTLCILFWQGEGKTSDANSIGNSEQSVPESIDFMDMGMGASYDEGKTTLKAQRDYLRMLREACQEHAEIKFVQLNTDKLAAAEKAAAQAAGNPHIKEAGPLVFAADPDSKAQKFVGIKAEKPFLTVVDKEGKVKYAGTAGGFVPAFILTELTGVEIDLDKQMQAANAHQIVSSEMMDSMMLEMMDMQEMGIRPAKPVRDPNKPVADPNAPAADPNAVAIRQSVSSQSSMTAEQVSLEYQAGKELEYAEFYINAARKRFQTYKQGIEQCRAIIEKYPGTQYEEQARLLLRRVPEHKRATYNITDEELGL